MISISFCFAISNSSAGNMSNLMCPSGISNKTASLVHLKTAVSGSELLALCDGPRWGLYWAIIPVLIRRSDPDLERLERLQGEKIKGEGNNLVKDEARSYCHSFIHWSCMRIYSVPRRLGAIGDTKCLSPRGLVQAQSHVAYRWVCLARSDLVFDKTVELKTFALGTCLSYPFLHPTPPQASP